MLGLVLSPAGKYNGRRTKREERVKHMKKRQAAVGILLVSLCVTACGVDRDGEVQDEPQKQVLAGEMTAILPEQLTVGSVDEGKCVFVSDDDEVKAYFETLAEPLAEPTWCQPGGVTLWQKKALGLGDKDEPCMDSDLPWNHAECLIKEDMVQDNEVSGYVVLAEHDLYTAASLAQAEQQYGKVPDDQQTVQIWHGFLIQPDSDHVYEVWLNADLFSKEQLMQVIKSAVF